MSLIYTLFLYFGLAGSAMPPVAQAPRTQPGALHQYHQIAQPADYVCSAPLTPWMCKIDK